MKLRFGQYCAKFNSTFDNCPQVSNKLYRDGDVNG